MINLIEKKILMLSALYLKQKVLFKSRINNKLYYGNYYLEKVLNAKYVYFNL